MTHVISKTGYRVIKNCVIKRSRCIIPVDTQNAIKEPLQLQKNVPFISTGHLEIRMLKSDPETI